MKPGLCPDMPMMVNDWLSSTSITLMAPAQEGALLRLLLHAWNDPTCSLPDGDAQLAALSRLGHDWEQLGPAVRACFESDPSHTGRIFNPKQRGIRLAQESRIQAASDHGKKANKVRWNKSPSNPRALPEKSPSNPRAIPNGIPKNPSSPVSRLTTPLNPQRDSRPTIDPDLLRALD
jgi:uncharacterized protein YdaU (DUF1376 family)